MFGQKAMASTLGSRRQSRQAVVQARARTDYQVGAVARRACGIEIVQVPP